MVTKIAHSSFKWAVFLLPETEEDKQIILGVAKILGSSKIKYHLIPRIFGKKIPYLAVHKDDEFTAYWLTEVDYETV